MRRHVVTFFALASILLFVGSGCLSSDVSLVIDFINAWAQSHNIVDKDGKPTPTSIAYVGSGGWVSSGDPVTDAAIDAGVVIKSIHDADKKLKDADSALEKDPPDRNAAANLIDSALQSRPRDQGVRSRKGAFLIETGKPDEARQYLATNDPKCDPTQNPLMSKGKMEQCYRFIANEDHALLNAEFRTWSKNNAGMGPTCVIKNQRVATLSRLENLAEKMGNAALADDYSQEQFRLMMQVCH